MMKKIIITIVVVLLVCLVVVSDVMAASADYYGLTTINYHNRITDFGVSGWNPGYRAYTSPYRIMDQFGLTFWSAYCSCNYVIDYSSYNSYDSSYAWMMRYNVNSIADGMAKSKISCGAQTLRGHNYVQYWWQDSGYSGAGGTLNTNMILTQP